MSMISQELVFWVLLVSSVAGLTAVALAKRITVARRISLVTIAIPLATVLLSRWFEIGVPSGLASQNLLPYILIGNLLAVFYSPAMHGANKTYAFILGFNFLSIVLWSTESATMVWLAIPLFFLGLLIGHIYDKGTFRVLFLYGMVVTGLITIPMLFADSGIPGSNLPELIGLILLCGMYPISPWYSRLYEKSTTGLLATSFIFQIVIILKIEQMESLVRDDFLILLPILALFSLLVAIAQPGVRRALGGIAASQLSFLVFALSGGHFSDISGMLLAQSQLITIPGVILTVGILETRTGKLSLARPTGHYESYPKLATSMLLFGLMGAGFPLSLSYIAEDLVLEAGIQEVLIQEMAWLVVTAISAIAIVKMYLYLFHGGKGSEIGIDILPPKLFAAVAACLFLVVSSVTLPL